MARSMPSTLPGPAPGSRVTFAWTARASGAVRGKVGHGQLRDGTGLSMAVIHDTTMSPGKLELLTAWLPAQPWYLDGGRAPALTRPAGSGSMTRAARSESSSWW